MTPWRTVAWLGLGLSLAALLAWTPPLQRLERAWQDFSLRQLAEVERAGSTLVIDVDASSLEELRPNHGNWPFSRELHAQLVQQLLDAGARSVVLNFLFESPRTGDETLRAVIGRHPGQVVLAAAAGRTEASAVEAPQGRKPPLPSTPIDGLRMPSPTVAPPGAAIGLMSVAWGADGVQRCLPLLQRHQGQILPSLPLATLVQAGASFEVQQGLRGRTLSLGPHRWPVDASGCLLLRLPANADAVPALRYAALASSADWSDAIRAAVRGRTVFVGSPSLMDLRVMTPAGQLGGTQWQALAHEALLTGHWLAPSSPIEHLAWLALALVPAGLAARRMRPRPAVDLGIASAVALLLVGAGWLVQGQFARMAPVVPMLLVIVCGATLLVLRWQRWLDHERVRARADQAAAEAGSRAKTEFMAHMSHEIRTPLNAVLGMGQLLAETPLNAMQRRYVEVFSSAGRHLQQLIEDMLDLSRVEAGRLDLHRAAFDPRELVVELQALFEPRATAQALRLHATCDAGVPLQLVGDAHRLRQVLVNLLGNALKFTREGEVRLTVSPDPAQSGWVRWEVADTGVGIAPDRLRAVFEPFTQADTSTQRQFGGTGLGLTITRQLAELMGGTVDLQSNPGRGTTITLALPLPAGDPAAAQPVSVGTDAAHADAQGRRVLLAEDNAHNVAVVQGMLAACGLTIDVANDGRAAVEMAARTRYDLILMDVQMPLLDGHQATREIRRAEQAAGLAGVPILALSANAMPSDVQASLRAGCDRHLSKPIDKSALHTALAALLGLASKASPAAEVTTPSETPAESTLATLDRLSALERLGGDQALYDRVLDAAQRQFDGWQQAFDAAVAGGDLATCRRLAHDLRSVAGTIGALRAAQAAAELERCCLLPEPALARPCAAVRDELQALRQALRQA